MFELKKESVLEDNGKRKGNTFKKGCKMIENGIDVKTQEKQNVLVAFENAISTKQSARKEPQDNNKLTVESIKKDSVK